MRNRQRLVRTRHYLDDAGRPYGRLRVAYAAPPDLRAWPSAWRGRQHFPRRTRAWDGRHGGASSPKPVRGELPATKPILAVSYCLPHLPAYSGGVVAFYARDYCATGGCAGTWRRQPPDSGAYTWEPRGAPGGIRCNGRMALPATHLNYLRGHPYPTMRW